MTERRSRWTPELQTRLHELLSQNTSDDDICKELECIPKLLKFRIGDLAVSLLSRQGTDAVNEQEILRLCRMSEADLRGAQKRCARIAAKPTKEQRATIRQQRREARKEARSSISERDAELLKQLDAMRRMILNSYKSKPTVQEESPV
jgi:hypothetical protein